MKIWEGEEWGSSSDGEIDGWIHGDCEREIVWENEVVMVRQMDVLIGNDNEWVAIVRDG